MPQRDGSQADDFNTASRVWAMIEGNTVFLTEALKAALGRDEYSYDYDCDSDIMLDPDCKEEDY